MNSTLKRSLSILGAVALISGTVAIVPFGQNSLACGWGNSGGEAFAPQQNSQGSFNRNGAISKDQAVSIVTQHVKRLNPELRIGNVNDAGALYEAEILSPADEEVLQVIGVYKQSGRVVVIN